MIISTLSVNDQKHKKDIFLCFANEKYKVVIDASITEHETSTHSFHKHIKIKVYLDKMFIENTFYNVNTYIFKKLIEKKDELKHHLPRIAKIVIEELSKDYTISLEDLYNLIVNLLEKLIEKRDYTNIISDFENNISHKF